MTVWIKEGVHGPLNPMMRRAKGSLVRLYELGGMDFHITSKGEGKHMPSSCHYEMAAMDFKRQGVAKHQIKNVLAVKHGDGFDVVEYPALDIFHVEWDPK